MRERDAVADGGSRVPVAVQDAVTERDASGDCEDDDDGVHVGDSDTVAVGDTREMLCDVVSLADATSDRDSVPVRASDSVRESDTELVGSSLFDLEKLCSVSVGVDVADSDADPKFVSDAEERLPESVGVPVGLNVWFRDAVLLSNIDVDADRTACDSDAVYAAVMLNVRDVERDALTDREGVSRMADADGVTEKDCSNDVDWGITDSEGESVRIHVFDRGDTVRVKLLLSVPSDEAVSVALARETVTV